MGFVLAHVDPSRVAHTYSRVSAFDLKLHWRNHRSFVRSSVITLARPISIGGKAENICARAAIFGFGSQDWTMNELAPLMVFLSLSV